MFVLANFVQAVAVVLGYVIEFFWWLIVIRALLSWVNPDPNKQIVQYIERVTEPLLYPFRKIVPSYKLGSSLSPLFAILFLYFLKIFAVQTLSGIAALLR